MSGHDGPGQGRKEAGKALRAFRRMLSDPAERQAFAADPRAYLAQHDVDFDKLPQSLQELLLDLSGNELTFLAGMQDKLDRAQLLEDRPDDAGGFATLAKF